MEVEEHRVLWVQQVHKVLRDPLDLKEQQDLQVLRVLMVPLDLLVLRVLRV